MLTKFTVIYPANRRKEVRVIDWPEEPSLDQLRQLINPIVGGELERVNVFWEDKYTDMFFNGEGLRLGLRKNTRATTIYWNNVLTHVKDAVQDDTCVVGVAVLFDRKVWF